MKPKTSQQKLVVALSAELKSITDKQKAWSYSYLDKLAVLSRKTLFCLECGHSWKDHSLGESAPSKFNCPCCNSKLQLNVKGISRDCAYFAILTTHKGMQVVRMFFSSKHYKKLKKPECWAVEVMQHWIDETGNVVTLSKQVNGFNQAYDAWLFHSDIEVRAETYRCRLRQSITPFKIYPERKVLPVIKRNGFNNSFFDLSPSGLFSIILTNNFAETLLKTKQIPMLKHCYKKSSFQGYKSSIKICIRNGYIIPDASLWEDYIDLLVHFGKDVHNPKYVCPNNLKEAHDRLVKKKTEEDRRKELDDLRKQINKSQKNFLKQKGKFFSLRFSDKNLTIEPLKTVEDFLFEGETLNHCVFSNEYFKKKDSLILSARIDNKPIETIEVSLKNLAVVQSRGKGNKASENHLFILDLINKNMPQIAALV
jgi:hypothetical protein